jgi:hypothetical protein
LVQPCMRQYCANPSILKIGGSVPTRRQADSANRMIGGLLPTRVAQRKHHFGTPLQYDSVVLCGWLPSWGVLHVPKGAEIKRPPGRGGAPHSPLFAFQFLVPRLSTNENESLKGFPSVPCHAHGSWFLSVHPHNGCAVTTIPQSS